MSTAGRALRRHWPPLAVWAAAAVCVALVAARSGYHPLAPPTWERWDAALYQDIAARGYTLMPCPEGPGGRAQWCGNAGWFPLYPWLLAALRATGLPIRPSAVAVAWLFTGATLVLLWRTFLRGRATVAAGAALVYAAFAPGQVYGYASFPMSMLAFFTVAHLWALGRGRYLVAGLAGAAAALSYPIGAMLAPVSALWLLADRSVPRGTRLRRVAVTTGLIVAALVLLMAVQWAQTGRWDAYFLVHAKYDHGFRNPAATYWDGLDLLFEGWLGYLESAAALQHVFVALVLLTVLVAAVVRRARVTRLHVLLGLWAAFTWAFPLTQANLSSVRAEAALLPVAALLVELPRPVVAAFAAVAVVLSVPVTTLFLQSKLV